MKFVEETCEITNKTTDVCGVLDIYKNYADWKIYRKQSDNINNKKDFAEHIQRHYNISSGRCMMTGKFYKVQTFFGLMLQGHECSEL